MKNFVKTLLFIAFFVLPIQAIAQPIGQLQPGQVWGNPNGTQQPATGAQIGAILDQGYSCTAQGSIMQRGASLWSCLGSGATAGKPLLSGGTGANLSYGTLGYVGGGTNANTQAGATNNLFPTPTRAGDIVYWDGTAWVSLPGNNSGTLVLQETATGVPNWATVTGTGTVTEQKNTAGNGLTISGTCDNTTSNAASPCQYALSTITGPGVLGASGSGAGQAVGTVQTPILLATLTASSSPNLSDTTHFAAGFSSYLLKFRKLVPASASVSCVLQLQVSSSPVATGYVHQWNTILSGTGTSNAATSYIPLCNAGALQTVSGGLNGDVEFPAFIGNQPYFGHGMYNFSGPGASGWFLGGYLNNASSPNGIQFCFSSAAPTCNVNIASGFIEIWGIP